MSSCRCRSTLNCKQIRSLRSWPNLKRPASSILHRPSYRQSQRRLNRNLEVAVADLHGKRILVTGGAGFIGSHIVDLLTEEGCSEIVVLDNMVRGRPENIEDARRRAPVRLVDGDIRDRNLLASLVKSADIVFHQA